nr:methyltransferase domain-containing protein [Streptomyces sp. NRRL B-24484]
MLDYDGEAATYDATRGGEERAGAAALLVDVACGTGIVTARLRRPGRTVLGVDRSGGMAAVAAGRLPGHVLLGDAGRSRPAGRTPSSWSGCCTCCRTPNRCPPRPPGCSGPAAW